MDKKIKEPKNFPQWFQCMIPFISFSLSVLAVLYAVFLFNQETVTFVQWVRIVIFALMGLIFITSTIIYTFNPELAWEWLIGGVSLVPILLMLQLLILFVTVIKKLITIVFQGEIPMSLRTFIENYPSKFDIVILVVIFVVGVLWIMNKLPKK